MEIKKMNKKLQSVWELRFYEVWGNSEDGYEVNDISYIVHEYPLELNVEKFNPGTEHEFLAAYPTDQQIKNAFGVDCDLFIDGDDINIYVHRDEDYYPIGQMTCLDYSSLSAIGKRDQYYAKNEYEYN
jgi:hypothetical protein